MSPHAIPGPWCDCLFGSSGSRWKVIEGPVPYAGNPRSSIRACKERGRLGAARSVGAAFGHAKELSAGRSGERLPEARSASRCSVRRSAPARRARMRHRLAGRQVSARRGHVAGEPLAVGQRHAHGGAKPPPVACAFRSNRTLATWPRSNDCDTRLPAHRRCSSPGRGRHRCRNRPSPRQRSRPRDPAPTGRRSFRTCRSPRVAEGDIFSFRIGCSLPECTNPGVPGLSIVSA